MGRGGASGRAVGTITSGRVSSIAPDAVVALGASFSFGSVALLEGIGYDASAIQKEYRKVHSSSLASTRRQ
jgi:hypothetical protein